MDDSLFQAALIGYQVEVTRIESKIAEVRALLEGSSGSIATRVAKSASKRSLSAAARKKIAAGQKRRWAAYREARAYR